MITLSVQEIATAVGGRVEGDPAALVTGAVVADSRQVEPGALFAALPGERVDGHDFVPAARAAGAAAVLATRPVGGPTVLVDDVQDALGRLARAVLDRLGTGGSAGTGPAVIGLTGSSGKTTTKDLLAALVARVGETIAPPGSFNNELGVPLTVLRATERTRYLVMEFGARSMGHIRYLCQIAPPSIGVVLNVGSAHVGEFGSRDRIALAKGELVEALPAEGVAVLNADDPRVSAMAARTSARVVRFGTDPAAQVRAERIELDRQARAGFALVTPQGRADVRLRVYGLHQVSNSLAAAAVATELGLATDEIAELLGKQEAASRWRMEICERPDGVLVINDAYNANPESVQAALQATAVIGAGRRTWVVLGEMLELGEVAEAEHESIGRMAVQLGADRVLAVGPGARPVEAGARAAGGEPTWLPDVPAAALLLAEELNPGDVVLVKASRSIGLDRLAEAVLAQGEGHG